MIDHNLPVSTSFNSSVNSKYNLDKPFHHSQCSSTSFRVQGSTSARGPNFQSKFTVKHDSRVTPPLTCLRNCHLYQQRPVCYTNYVKRVLANRLHIKFTDNKMQVQEWTAFPFLKSWFNFMFSVAGFKFQLRDDGQVCRCQRPATNETGTRGFVARKLIRHSLTALLSLRSKLHPHIRGKKSHGGTLLSHFSRSTWKTGKKHSAFLNKNIFPPIHYETVELIRY